MVNKSSDSDSDDDFTDYTGYAQIPSEPNSQEPQDKQIFETKSTSCSVTEGSTNFSSSYSDNRTRNPQQPYQIQQLFTKALELPPKPKEEKIEFPDEKKPEIDVDKIKNVMKNVNLPPIEKSSVSSLSSKMKDLSDDDFRKVMQNMLNKPKK